jgi:hypothetical protein
MSILQKLALNASGAAMDESLLIMLQALSQRDGKASFSQLVAAVEERTGGATLSPEQRQLLYDILVSQGFRRSLVILPPTDSDTWTLDARGRDFLQRTATEIEDPLGGDEAAEEGEVPLPFDPSKIRVDNRQMTLFQVLRKIDRGEIWLQPDFQRNVVWDDVRKSRLIESALLRIPLPAFYLDAADDDKWQVVDGLQRLSTFQDFYSGRLQLTGLEFLVQLNHKRYREIPRSYQRQLEDSTILNINIIQPETPRNVKFMIFNRVNTGGLPLTAQEIRHALYEGPVRGFLKGLAESGEFLEATTGSVSPLRMDDRECVLRFLAFFLFPYERFGRRNVESSTVNLETLLNQTMDQLNSLSEQRRGEIGDAFRSSMRKARIVFGDYAFRKLYERNGRRNLISKALFEVWSVLLVPYPQGYLHEKASVIQDRFIEIMRYDNEFGVAISSGTGSRRSILKRFGTIERLLQETVA